MLPRVVWAEESKNGLGFEIGPSYDVVPTRSQLVIHSQSSCTLPMFAAEITRGRATRDKGLSVSARPGQSWGANKRIPPPMFVVLLRPGTPQKSRRGCKKKQNHSLVLPHVFLPGRARDIPPYLFAQGPVPGTEYMTYIGLLIGNPKWIVPPCVLPRPASITSAACVYIGNLMFNSCD